MKGGYLEDKKLMGIVFIVHFPRGMYEPSDRWRSTVRKTGLARRQKRSRPRLFLQRRPDGPQLHIPDRQLSNAKCLELCRADRVSYRQNSPSTTKLGTGAFLQSTRRYHEAVLRSDLGPGRRSTARLKRNRKRNARHQQLFGLY